MRECGTVIPGGSHQQNGAVSYPSALSREVKRSNLSFGCQLSERRIQNGKLSPCDSRTLQSRCEKKKEKKNEDGSQDSREVLTGKKN